MKIFLPRTFAAALVLLVIATTSQAAYTNRYCKGSCSEASTPGAGNGRALGNKVSDNFNGWVDVWSNAGASTMATNLLVRNGQAWPRISEGVVVPNVKTRGYPIRLNNYLALGKRYISYKGQWTARSHGPNGPTRGPAPRGARYNGAYIWLNDPSNYHPGTKNPIWAFTVEVNIWNRYDNGIDKVSRKRDYYDSNGKYQVYGGRVQRGSVSFYAYFVVNESRKGMADMTINTVALLKHLRDHCGMSSNLDIIEMAVAAEGHAGADGKFIADIATMGRP